MLELVCVGVCVCICVYVCVYMGGGIDWKCYSPRPRQGWSTKERVNTEMSRIEDGGSAVLKRTRILDKYSDTFMLTAAFPKSYWK